MCVHLSEGECKCLRCVCVCVGGCVCMMENASNNASKQLSLSLSLCLSLFLSLPAFVCEKLGACDVFMQIGVNQYYATHLIC